MGEEEDQTAREVEDKRTIRALRKHLDAVRERRDEAADPETEKLAEFFKENDDLHDKSNLIIHQSLVAQSFLELSQAAKVQSRRLQTSLRNFSPTLLIETLASRAQREQETLTVTDAEFRADFQDSYFDFEELGDQVWKHYRFAPRIDFMYGLQEFKRKERVINRTRVRHQQDKGEAVKPQTVSMNDTVSKTLADKDIEQIDTMLRKEKNVDLYDFAVSEQSFSSSIENLFYLSFLVKDGRAKVVADRVGAKAFSVNSEEAKRQASAENKQVILRFDYNRWMDVVNSKMKRKSTEVASQPTQRRTKKPRR